jgi:RHH-type rel operon transcriptional repressor/antitoxin RelB
MPTSVRLDPSLERRLDLLAAQTGRTKAYYLRELVAAGLDDIERRYLAAATRERARKGTGKTRFTTRLPEWPGKSRRPAD